MAIWWLLLKVTVVAMIVHRPAGKAIL